jgi:hypothetical protein
MFSGLRWWRMKQARRLVRRLCATRVSTQKKLLGSGQELPQHEDVVRTKRMSIGTAPLPSRLPMMLMLTGPRVEGEIFSRLLHIQTRFLQMLVDFSLGGSCLPDANCVAFYSLVGN